MDTKYVSPLDAIKPSEWQKGENEYQNYEEIELDNGDLLQIIALKHEEPPLYNGYITRNGEMKLLSDDTYNEYEKMYYGAKNVPKYGENRPLVCTDPMRMKLAVINAYRRKRSSGKLPSMKEVYEYGSR